MPELLIILVIALIVFGPEKLPEVAANAGKMVREMRSVMHEAMNPDDYKIPDDFSSYFHESMERGGEEVPTLEDPHEGVNGAAEHNAIEHASASSTAEASSGDIAEPIDLSTNRTHDLGNTDPPSSAEVQKEHPA